MKDTKINRINELAKKSRNEGLTEEEKLEQKKLREEYVSAFRNNLRSTLDTIVIVDENGNKKRIKK